MNHIVDFDKNVLSTILAISEAQLWPNNEFIGLLEVERESLAFEVSQFSVANLSTFYGKEEN